jgi:hypothetical protein
MYVQHTYIDNFMHTIPKNSLISIQHCVNIQK